MRRRLSSVQQDEQRALASEVGDEQAEEAAVGNPMTCLWDQHACEAFADMSLTEEGEN